LTQSVELLLDDTADAEIRLQWDRLGDAGLPTARRTEPSPHHAPHVSLWAGGRLRDAAESRLPPLFTDLDLEVVIGGLLLFGPHRGGYILVRQVMVSTALATLQQRVVEICGSGYSGQFRDGRWSPHITLARRTHTDQIGQALRALAGSPAELTATVRRARRWDGNRKVAWLLSGSTS
jgi:2'-5' RNA ligase